MTIQVRLAGAIALSVLLMPALPRGASGTELTGTDPAHILEAPRISPFSSRNGQHRPSSRRPQPYPSSNLLAEDDNRGFRDLRRESELSRLCRARQFLQVRDRLFIVRLKGRIYGAAIGGHWSLEDRKGAANPGVVYVMHQQDTTRCEVRRMDLTDG